MNYKKLIANLIIFVILAGISIFYYKIKEKHQKTFRVVKTSPEHSFTKKIDVHKMENFVYDHYRKDKKLFTLSAKFHIMLENQRSEMEIINIIIYDDKGKKSYEINAEKGFITKDRDLIVLWRNVYIKNIKGWEIKTSQVKYFPKEEILYLPVKSFITWEEKNIKGKAQSMKYYPKRKELEFIGSVSLTQNKDNNIIEIMGEHLILNEQNDNGILEGNPAKIRNNQSKIFGNKIIFNFYSDERTIKSADIYEDVLLIYSKEEVEEGSDERNIRAVGNTMKLEFDKEGRINSWSLYGNAEVKASEVKENIY